jgi:murein peptide amidase A
MSNRYAQPQYNPLSPFIGAATLFSLFGLMSVSCIDPSDRSKDRADRSPSAGQRRTIGRSVEGRPIESHTFGNGRDIVLIMATIHGNEDAGTPLSEKLIDHLQANPNLVAGRRVIIIADANPDGRHHQLRYNARGVDLNRNFPSGNYKTSSHHGDKPLSEPESDALHALIKREMPSRIISIHQPLNYGSECIDYDGPGESIAHAMANHTSIPVKRIGSRPGSLGSFAGETLGIPIITLELPKEAKGRDATSLWNDYGKMLLAAITHGGA